MQPLLDSLSSVFTSTEIVVPFLNQWAFLLVWAAAGLLLNAYLANRALFEGEGRVHSDPFEHWDALLAAALVGFFLYLTLVAGSSDNSSGHDATRNPTEMVVQMVGGAFIFFLFILGILVALTLRQIQWREAFGFSRLGAPRIIGLAAVLIFLAIPLVNISGLISQLMLAAGGDDDASRQELVNFFIHSHSTAAKCVLSVFAVIVAPMQEEFLFRGYIYGVARRYGGVIFGVLVNASLFALIHMHLPSFIPLFVLAVCLTLAYECTGSLWVPMCMHAMFNAITVLSIMLGYDI